MKIKVTNVALCTGGGHVIFDLLLNDTTAIRRAIEKTELLIFMRDKDDRDTFLTLACVEIKKAGATTLAQMRTALLNKEWEW